MLTLPEELLLLSYHEAKTPPFNAYVSWGLVGAVLAELLIEKKIQLAGSDLRCEGTGPAGNPILDDALTIMRCSAESHAAKYWVVKLHSLLRRLRPRVADALVTKGVFQSTEHKRLGLCSTKSYRLADPRPALALKDQLRQVLFQPIAPNPRQMALIGLAEPLGLKLFTREERHAVRARIGEILQRDDISKAVADAIARTNAAVATSMASSVAWV